MTSYDRRLISIGQLVITNSAFGGPQKANLRLYPDRLQRSSLNVPHSDYRSSGHSGEMADC